MQNSQLASGVKTSYFPPHLLFLEGEVAKVKLTSPASLGVTARIYLHEIARRLPSYQQKIVCSAYGVDKEENLIPVNSVGRWLFGVPGYQGHLRVVAYGNDLTLYFPQKSPAPVFQLIDDLKPKLASLINQK